MINQFNPVKLITRALIPGRPWYVIFYVTSKCNLRCKMCFYWKKLNNDILNELKLDEIETISHKLKNIYQLTLTGGEPFLREDIESIVELFYRNTDAQRITIATNGFLSGHIAKKVEGILKKVSKKTTIVIPLSIDGPEEVHDEIRGVRGSFIKVSETFKLLTGLQAHYPNLIVNTVTVVSKANENCIINFLDYVEENFNINNHGLMIARGHTKDKDIKDVSFTKYREFIDILNSKSSKAPFLTKCFLETIRETELKIIEEKRMIDSCQSGVKLIVINERGSVYPCELLETLRQEGRHFDANSLKDISDFSFGNLRDNNYDVMKLMNSKKAKKIVNFIKKGNCACTWECAILNNFALSFPAYLRLAKHFGKRIFLK